MTKVFPDQKDLLAHPVTAALMDFQAILGQKAAKDHQAVPEALDCLEIKGLLVKREKKAIVYHQVESAREINVIRVNLI